MAKQDFETLNISVLKALVFFQKEKPIRLNVKKYTFPIVIGSGNAYHAGQIIFSQQKALFATETNLIEVFKRYKDLIKSKVVTHAVVISASGEKDSVWEIKLAKKIGLKTVLLTCSPNSTAAKLADEVHSFRKLEEPYTYNVSTYLGMILAAGGEKAADIAASILKLKLPNNFKKFKAYAFILPDEMASITPMIEIKKSELFGPNLSIRAFSYGEARHAKFVIREKSELVISFGENKYFGNSNNRLIITPPKNAGAAWMMAVNYFLVGLIQSAKPDYFSKNIKKFCADYGYKAYPDAKPFTTIVPGN
ncbi:MAG: hypothetical protein Q8Q67_00275 [bacterium]|nr:hypothetical protein [bacterium]